MNLEKVTIGVCVRNCERYIAEAVKSIANQDYPHSFMEVIFVDGCSKDATNKIILQMSSKMDVATQMFSDNGKGLGYARNIVIANASGYFVLWVDGDMVLSNNFVSRLVSFMEENPDVGIAKGKQAVGSDANIVGKLEEYSRVMSHMVDYRSAKGRLKALGTSGCIYRKDVFRDAGVFDERLKGYGEDQDIELRVRAVGWLLDTVDVRYLDYERHGITWDSLWTRYWLRGYYTRHFLHKNKGVVKHYRIFPPSAFLSGIIQSFSLYKLSYQKVVFLLAFHNLFKMTAWYSGYIRSHIKNYAFK